jgi:hypothetical protein
MTTHPENNPDNNPESPAHIVVDPQAIAVNGICRVIFKKLYENAEEKIHQLQETERFVRTAGRHALSPRGFGIKTPPPEEPDTYPERIESSMIGFKVRKLIRINRQLHEITQFWGQKPEPSHTQAGIAAPEKNPFSDIARGRAIEAAKKKAKKDSELIVNFKKPADNVRESKKTLALRKRTEKRYEKLQKKKEQVLQKIDTRASGETFLGKRRTKKINKLQKKHATYKKKLGLS